MGDPMPFPGTLGWTSNAGRARRTADDVRDQERCPGREPLRLDCSVHSLPMVPRRTWTAAGAPVAISPANAAEGGGVPDDVEDADGVTRRMAEDVTAPLQVPTCIQGLDEVLGGGFLRSAAYIVQGPPGAGKTILANQLCFHHGARGGTALYVSLLAESHDRLLGYISGMSFYDAAAVPDRVFYVSAFPILQKEGPGALQRMVLEETRRRGATIVVLDGLFVVHDVFASEPEFRRFVHEMQGMASLTQCTLLMLTNQDRARSAPEHTMVDGWIELLDEIHALRAVRAIVVHKQRGTDYLRGRHMFRITGNGIAVFPRMEALQRREPDASATTGRVGSGIEPFDTMLFGGYPAASATFILGPSGSGKTTMGLQFLSACTAEEPGVLFGFFETPVRLMAKARSVGIDLEGLVASGAIEVIWQPDAENLVDELGHRLVAAVRRRQAKRVVVDGVGAIERAMLFRQRLPSFINAINNAVKPLGATMIYTRETSELHALDRLGNDDMSAMAENLILIHYIRQDRMLRRMLSILKVRDSDFDPVTEEFYITSEGLRFGPRPLPPGRPAGVLDVPGDAAPIDAVPRPGT